MLCFGLKCTQIQLFEVVMTFFFLFFFCLQLKLVGASYTKFLRNAKAGPDVSHSTYHFCYIFVCHSLMQSHFLVHICCILMLGDIPVFLNQARAHSWPYAPGLLKLFPEVCVCTYLCLYALTHVSKPF